MNLQLFGIKDLLENTKNIVYISSTKLFKGLNGLKLVNTDAAHHFIETLYASVSILDGSTKHKDLVRNIKHQKNSD